MKSSPLVQLLECFIVFFLFLFGAVLLIVGMEPERLWKLAVWIEESKSHCIWVGSVFVGVATFLTYTLVRLYSSRVLELKLYRSKGKVVLDAHALKTCITHFWDTQTHFPLPSQVNVNSKGSIAITAKAPFTAFTEALEAEQRQMLLSFEKNLIETLDQQLGYKEPIILRWILPSSANVHIQDI